MANLLLFRSGFSASFPVSFSSALIYWDLPRAVVDVGVTIQSSSASSAAKSNACSHPPLVPRYFRLLLKRPPPRSFSLSFYSKFNSCGDLVTKSHEESEGFVLQFVQFICLHRAEVIATINRTSGSVCCRRLPFGFQHCV